MAERRKRGWTEREERELQRDLDRLVEAGRIERVTMEDGTVGYRASLALMEPQGRA